MPATGPGLTERLQDYPLLAPDSAPLPRESNELLFSLLDGARRGDPTSMEELAFHLTLGTRLKADRALARQLLQLPAMKGSRSARRNLALMCMNGEGGPHDYGAARRWLESALRQGYDAVCSDLAELEELERLHPERAAPPPKLPPRGATGNRKQGKPVVATVSRKVPWLEIFVARHRSALIGLGLGVLVLVLFLLGLERT